MEVNINGMIISTQRACDVIFTRCKYLNVRRGKTYRLFVMGGVDKIE